MKTLTLNQVLANGLTPRTLNAWANAGLLHPIRRGRDTPAEWPQQELQAADLMRRLVHAGLTPQAAARTARTYAQACLAFIKLGPGIVIAVDTSLLEDAADA